MLMIHTALHAEALALINYYKLKRQLNIKPYACYAGDGVFLIESGIGKIHTASAIAWANATIAAISPVWVNIGMAGHSERAIGSCLLARCIKDKRSDQRACLHPLPTSISDSEDPLPASIPDSEDLLTLDEPEDSYPAGSMVDMEGSAFVSVANRFTSPELIQSIKVISDNTQNPAQRLKTGEVETLFVPHLDIIDQTFQQLSSLRDRLISQADSI